MLSMPRSAADGDTAAACSMPGSAHPLPMLEELEWRPLQAPLVGAKTQPWVGVSAGMCWYS